MGNTSTKHVIVFKGLEMQSQLKETEMSASEARRQTGMCSF